MHCFCVLRGCCSGRSKGQVILVAPVWVTDRAHWQHMRKLLNVSWMPLRLGTPLSTPSLGSPSAIADPVSNFKKDVFGRG